MGGCGCVRGCGMICFTSDRSFYAGLVLLVFCVVLVNYKAGQDKDEVQPELAPSERVHKVPDRIIQKPPDDSEEEKEEGPFIDEDGEVRRFVETATRTSMLIYHISSCHIS